MREFIDKATTLLRFVKIITEVSNDEKNISKHVQDVDYTYFMKIVDNNSNEITKFTVGIKEGKFSLHPSYEPDVIITLTENAFFGILKGKMTLEEAYFGGEADLFSKDGHWTSHVIGIKKTFDHVEGLIREKIKDKI